MASNLHFRGRKSKTYIAKSNMKSATCIKECLNQRLLPFLLSHKDPPFLARCCQWCYPPNSPHIRLVERYWALVKQQLRKHQKVATNALSFQKYWNAAANKVNESVVRRLMEGLASKVNKFSRTPINC